jgi:hypothetical protein
MIETKNDIKIIKNPENNTPKSLNLENIKKNSSFTKEATIAIKKSYSNHIDCITREDSKSKFSFIQKNRNKTVLHRKSKTYKINKKEKSRNKLSKLLKNERLKIPTGKRTSIANNNIKLNLNNIESIINDLNKQKCKLSERVDTYWNKINKENKKNVHIRYLDNFPTKKLIEIVPIQSFKAFNMIETVPEEEFITLCSKCCQVF